MLRAGLLEGVSVVVARAGDADEPSAVADAVRETSVQLGARVSDLVLTPGGVESPGEAALDGGVTEDEALERAVDDVLGEVGHIELLAVDAAGLFGGASDNADGEGRDALVDSLQASWNVTRAVVNRAFLCGGESVLGGGYSATGAGEPGEAAGGRRGGRIVYLAPRPNAGAHAGAACAGLENLARTLSIEWARYRITTVTVAAGVDTSDGQLATLVAYLASPAGAYFSGCLLDLRGVRA